MSRFPGVLADDEVVELLADEPELLALADAIAVTQRPRRRRRLRPGVMGLAAVLALSAAAILLVPERGGDERLLGEALAAIGRRPVVHARIEARLPQSRVVELATGRAAPQTVSLEYWFDEPRARLRTVVRRGGVIVEELLETPARSVSSRGLLRAAGGQPALDPALTGFVTRYRDALARGEARVAGEGKIGGREIVSLELTARGVRERVAVDAKTYVPLRITPLDEAGRAGSLTWTVRRIETVARVEADFAVPQARLPAPYRGDVRASRPLSSDEAAESIAWPALWLGESWRGLALVSFDRETLTRGYPPGSGVRPTRGDGLRLRYAAGGEKAYVELSQAPFPEPAYAFAGGELTFAGNPIPLEGRVELVALGGREGRALGQLRRNGVYVTIWASGRALALQAARALAPVASRRADG